jgi:triphosphoribosyl-dephospho-CoA synthase
MAIRSLHAELCLYPKPGLVSPVDNGSHDDMTAATFMRSLFSLRHYFYRITVAGADGADFAALKRLAIAAERRMLEETGGINTHRGAIFSSGLLCAAIGRLHAQDLPLSAQAIRATLLAEWGAALAAHTLTNDRDSNGRQAARLHAASGAREEAAQGLPAVFDVALPTLRRTLAAGRPADSARIDALFALMAHVSDTNVYHRGGAQGAMLVRQQARQFMERGGTGQTDWQQQALECHELFIERRLSPGGAADLLGATCLVQMACA